MHDEERATETRLILTRHGASHHKADGVVGGPQGCRGLTAHGRRQAERLALRLVDDLREPPAASYCSVVPRAIETAAIVAATIGVSEPCQECGLCTWHTPPDADGQLWTAYRQQCSLPGGGVYRPFERGNESWSELVSRTGRSLEDIAIRHAHRTVLVVAHQETVVSSLIVFGALPLALGFDLQIAPTAITEWTTAGDPGSWPRPRWTLVRLNDAANLAHDTGARRSDGTQGTGLTPAVS